MLVASVPLGWNSHSRARRSGSQRAERCGFAAAGGLWCGWGDGGVGAGRGRGHGCACAAAANTAAVPGGCVAERRGAGGADTINRWGRYSRASGSAVATRSRKIAQLGRETSRVRLRPDLRHLYGVHHRLPPRDCRILSRRGRGALPRAEPARVHQKGAARGRGHALVLGRRVRRTAAGTARRAANARRCVAHAPRAGGGRWRRAARLLRERVRLDDATAALPLPHLHARAGAAEPLSRVRGRARVGGPTREHGGARLFRPSHARARRGASDTGGRRSAAQQSHQPRTARSGLSVAQPTDRRYHQRGHGQAACLGGGGRLLPAQDVQRAGLERHRHGANASGA
mmetsp:Transcript_13456/g.34357  ORF Transcript_13456/g.34357 Transcript_13456/m.34357 type:complete len:343 (-) Transcript_13456:1436-2464(-)